MADVRDAIEALHATANYAGDETARTTVQAYLDDTAPKPAGDDEADEPKPTAPKRR